MIHRASSAVDVADWIYHKLIRRQHSINEAAEEVSPAINF
jgi:hypothetical protein